MRDRIIIDKESIPYKFDITLGEEAYTLDVNYNKSADLFTIGLYKQEVKICAGEPVVYGMPLFANVYKPMDYPPLQIIPLDESGNESRVTWDNFGNTVFLTIDDGGEQDE